MRRRIRPIMTLLAPVPLAVLLVGAPAQAAAPIDYVALGDSYSSGTGAPPYTAGVLCLRSPGSYAQLWAASHHVASFSFVACGGATTTTMIPQLVALNRGTDLVTVTIGGNDVGFAQTMLTCVLGSDSACVDAVDTGTAVAAGTLPAALDRTYAAIRALAPAATVVVLGYPHLVDPAGACLSPAKRAALNQGADQLDETIASRAAAAGFRYVDPRARFAKHGACGSAPWIHEFSVTQLAESFHPNPAGYTQGYLALLTGVTG